MKEILIYFILSLILINYSIAQKSEVIPVDNSLQAGWQPGMGLALIEYESKESPFINKSMETTTNYQPEKYSLYFQNSEDEQINKFGINAYAQVKAIWGSANLRIGFEQTTEKKNRSISIIAYCYIIDSAQTMIDSIKLKRPAKEYVDKNKYRQFVNAYGTHYLKSCEWGKTISVQIILSEVTESESEQLKASLNVNVKSGLTSVDFNSSLDKFMSKKKQDDKISVSIAVNGRKKGALRYQIAGLVKALVGKKSFQDICDSVITLTTNSESVESTIINYVAVPYKNHVFNHLPSTLNIYDDAMVRKYWSLIDKYFEIINEIKIRKKLLNTFGINRQVKDAAKTDIKKLNNYSDKLANIYSKCETMCRGCCDFSPLDEKSLELHKQVDKDYPIDRISITADYVSGDDANNQRHIIIKNFPLIEARVIIEDKIVLTKYREGLLENGIDFYTNDPAFRGQIEYHFSELFHEDHSRNFWKEKPVLLQLVDILGREIAQVDIGRVTFNINFNNLDTEKWYWFPNPKFETNIKEAYFVNPNKSLLNRRKIEICCKQFSGLNVCHYNLKINNVKMRIVDRGTDCVLSDEDIKTLINNDIINLEPGWVSDCGPEEKCDLIQSGN